MDVLHLLSYYTNVTFTFLIMKQNASRSKRDSLKERNERLFFLVRVGAAAEQFGQFDGGNPKRPSHAARLLLRLDVLQVHSADADYLAHEKDALALRVLCAAQILRRRQRRKKIAQVHKIMLCTERNFCRRNAIAGKT